MGIFKRLRDLTVANVNELLDRAEDPEKMLNQWLRDLSDEIHEAEKSVAKQIAIKNKLEQQYNESIEMVTKREEQAMKALEAGNEDLARKALEDKKRHQEKADDFRAQLETAKANSDNLKKQLLEMKDKYEEMKNKKDLLVSRSEAAKAQKKINQSMSGFGNDNAARGFDRMSDKVREMEAEAEATRELNSSSSLDDELDALGDSSVDSELEALKKRMQQKKQGE